MDANAARKSKEKVDSELIRVQNALAVAEEARRNAKNMSSRLVDERVSLVLELGTCKDEVFAIRAEALKEKEAMEEAYEEGFDVIFNYGCCYCAFAYNIYRSQPEVPDGISNASNSLSPEFFFSP